MNEIIMTESGEVRRNGYSQKYKKLIAKKFSKYATKEERQALADKLGLGYKSTTNIITGNALPSPETAIKLSAITGVPAYTIRPDKKFLKQYK